jgi:hypothetical protein
MFVSFYRTPFVYASWEEGDVTKTKAAKEKSLAAFPGFVQCQGQTPFINPPEHLTLPDVACSESMDFHGNCQGICKLGHNVP